MDLSVIFSTYKSEGILKKSLQAYCAIKTTLQWELIIIDNACRKETKALIQRYQEHLSIVFLEQPIPGKNSAINKGLPLIKSDLIFFTDNDIIPASDIIDVYVNAAKKYHEFDIFSGKILPDIEMPKWIDTTFCHIQPAFGILNLGKEDQEVDPVTQVWGGNMAIRKSVFDQGLTFNNKIGPRGKSYIMGSESELLQRLKKLNHRAMYIASSSVQHQIRDEQLSVIWLVKRAFRAGKGEGFRDESNQNATKLFGFPRFYLRKLSRELFGFLVSLLFFNKGKTCRAMMSVSYDFGKIKGAMFRFDTHKKKIK